MSIRLAGPFRAGVKKVRATLEGRELMLFDLLCAAGQLGYRLPDGDINLRHAAGAKDPRRRLAREFSFLRARNSPAGGSEAWAAAASRLAHILAKELALQTDREERRALRVLLAYAAIALAPDCVVPRAPIPRAAWQAVVKLFARLFPANVKSVGKLECVERRLPLLQREAAVGLRVGRRASGQRPGRAGRELAVDPDLIASIGAALGKKLSPGFMARYLFYAAPGDHIWPHPDDPQWAATVLICVAHEFAPGHAGGSAFLAYKSNGPAKRLRLKPGSALAVEPGLIHAREPVRRGERVALLSIGLREETP